MAAFLLGQQFRETLHQGFEATDGSDLRHLLRRQQLFRQLAQPFLGEFAWQNAFGRFQTFEALCEYAVEAIEVAFVLHQGGAAQIVEVVNAPFGDAGLHSAEQGQILGD